MRFPEEYRGPVQPLRQNPGILPTALLAPEPDLRLLLPEKFSAPAERGEMLPWEQAQPFAEAEISPPEEK